MSGVSARSLEQAFQLVGEWQRVESVEQLARVATAGLRRLIPADGVGWNEIDLGTLDIRIVVDPPDYFSQPVDTLARLIHEHPIVEHLGRTGDGSATKISDHLSARDYHRRELYRGFFRPMGVEDQLALVIRVGAPLVGVAFNRDARTFGEADRSLLNLLRPHLAGAYEGVLARAAARVRLDALERGLAERGIGVAVVDGDALEPVSPGTRALLRRWFPRGLCALPRPGPGIVLERDDARLRLRLVPGEPPLLLLDEQRLLPDPERACELGLTRRETEILSLVARGLTDAEIAGRLVVSVRTVQKHLEHAYEKLGVRRRDDAAARLLAT